MISYDFISSDYFIPNLSFLFIVADTSITETETPPLGM